MKIIFKVMLVALIFCQFTLAADKKEEKNQSLFEIIVEPLETLQGIGKGVVVCVYPDKSKHQALRERYKKLADFKGDSLVIRGPFHLNDLFDDPMDEKFIFLTKTYPYPLKSIEMFMHEKPHLKFLEKLKYFYIENLAFFCSDIPTCTFFQHFIPSLPSLEEFTCNVGSNRLNFRFSNPLSKLSITLSSPKLRKVVFIDETFTITLERNAQNKWIPTILGDDGFLSQLHQELQDSLTSRPDAIR